MKSNHTKGDWYVAERALWQCDVRFVRTSEDTSGVVGVTNDRDAPLIAAAPRLLQACKDALKGIQQFQSGRAVTTEEVEEILVSAINQVTNPPAKQA